MGRRDAVQVTLEVISLMRSWEPRLIVSYEPGWETRGNGTSANYEGGIVHHTASASSLARPFPAQNILRNGRVGLSGPLCNEAGPACTVDAPRIHVVAALPANHAGASGGKSMGPLPVVGLFNPRVRGLEIDYAGTVPMLEGQLYVAHLWSKANAIVVGGGDINRIRAHMETSITGKWDPGYANGKTIDMAAFRRDAANIINSAPAPDYLGAIVADAYTPIITLPDGTQYSLGSALHTIVSFVKSRASYEGDQMNVHDGFGAAVATDDFGTTKQKTIRERDVIGELRDMAKKVNTGAVGSPGKIDVPADLGSQVAAALAGNQGFITAVGEAAAAAMDRRARDGDPKTGPVT